MIKNRKRFLCMLLTVLLVFSACNNGGSKETAGGGKGETVTEVLAPEYTYVAESVELPEGLEAYNYVFSNNAFYGLSSSYDEETGYVETIQKYPMENGKIGEPVEILKGSDVISINQFAVDVSGSVYVIMEQRPETDESEAMDEAAYYDYQSQFRYHLMKYSDAGELVFDTEFTESTQNGSYFYVQAFGVDDKGRSAIFSGDTGIILFDENGKECGMIAAGNNIWIQSMGCAKDGNLYAAYMNYDSNASRNVLAQIDFEGKKLGNSYTGFPFSYYGYTSSFTKGMEGDILAYDETGVYEYSMEKQEATKILTWIDLDVDGTSVSAVTHSDDGRLYAFVRSMEDGSNDLIAMNKVKASEVAKRETLIFATLYSDSDLTRKIVKFNKQSEKYRVSVKTYMDLNDWSDTTYQDSISNLTNDIISGNGPDLLDLNSLDIANLAQKGALENLEPYLKSSTSIQKDDFFPAILSASTYDGTLAYIPATFMLSTLAAKTSLVGDRMGWTLDDMISLSKAHPDAELLEYGTKSMILEMMLMLAKDHFIDTKAGQCQFDSKDFKDLLIFANTFPDEYDYSSHRLTPYRLAEDSLLLTDATIYDFGEIQSVLAYFGDEPVTFIGYPSFDGSNGCILLPGDRYGMSSGCSNKEGAWEVLEFLLSENENSDYGMMGFASRKTLFEKQKEEALDVQLVYDENGDPMTDEDGNPIYENGSSYTMMGDDGEEWTYVYRPIKVEEVDLVERLLDGATVIDTSVDNQLFQIISEEAESFFKGSKSVDEVAGIIQNRINLYLKENQ